MSILTLIGIYIGVFAITMIAVILAYDFYIKKRIKEFDNTKVVLSYIRKIESELRKLK